MNSTYSWKSHAVYRSLMCHNCNNYTREAGKYRCLAGHTAQPSVTKEDQENNLQLSLQVHPRGCKMFYLHSVFLHWSHMIVPLNSNLNNSVYHLSFFCSCISFQFISLIVLLCYPFLKYSTNFFFAFSLMIFPYDHP